MSNTDVSWRWDFVVFRLCNQNPTLSQRQIDVKYWRQPDFHFQPKCNVCLTSCPTSTWRYIDVWCLQCSFFYFSFLSFPLWVSCSQFCHHALSPSSTRVCDRLKTSTSHNLHLQPTPNHWLPKTSLLNFSKSATSGNPLSAKTRQRESLNTKAMQVTSRF